MTKLDDYERRVLGTFGKGKLESVASKSALAKRRAAARATTSKDRREKLPE